MHVVDDVYVAIQIELVGNASDRSPLDMTRKSRTRIHYDNQVSEYFAKSREHEAYRYSSAQNDTVVASWERMIKNG